MNREQFSPVGIRPDDLSKLKEIKKISGKSIVEILSEIIDKRYQRAIKYGK